ncbi:MAG TPA: hypothetical protein VNV85_18735, partial [Puia sp.]|nr:hypothetical protein [Puia sp.]
KNFYSYWDMLSENSKFEVPLLFSNTCNVDDGLKGILSPVLLDHKQFPSTDFVAEQVPATKRIALSTAAFLSARFPWITPTGKTSDNYHFIDGGVKENSGAETSENIYLALQKLYSDSVATKKSNPELYACLKKTRIYFISIANSSHSKSGPEKKVSNLFQLTSPLIALYNSGVDGNSQKADSTVRFRYNEIYASIWPDVDCIQLNKGSCDKFSPALPLGWQISLGALERLESSVTKKKYYDAISDSIPCFGKVKNFLKNAAIK